MLKELGKSLREFKKDSILAPLFVTFEVIFEVLIPYLMASLIDDGIYAGNMGYINRRGLIFVFSALGSVVVSMLSGRYAAFAATGLAKNLRRDIFYNIQEFSFANIDRFSTSSLISRMTTDISNLQNAYQMILRLLFKAPIMLVLSFFLVLSISRPVALILGIMIPLLGAGLYLLVKFAHPIFVRVFKRYDKLNKVVEENLHGIRVVKSFVREDFEIEKFQKASGEIYSDFVRAERLMALNMPMMMIAVYTCMMIISWVAGHLVISHPLPLLIQFRLQYCCCFWTDIAIIFVLLTTQRVDNS
jgi:ATP-binding cassette subfamily B protein